MVGVAELIEGVEKADEFLGRVPLDAVERASRALILAGHPGLGVVVEEAAINLAAARRTLARFVATPGPRG